MELSELIHATLSQKLQDKTVLIFGLGQEGFSSYQMIRHFLPDQKLLLVDDKAQEELSAEWQTAVAADTQTTFFRNAPESQTTSEALPKLLEQPQILVLKTPGIPFSHPFFSLLTTLPNKTVSYSSNMELFLDILHALPATERPQTIGITGTKGKSTTTALIFHVLKEAGKPVFLAGNIGVPALEILKELQKLVQTTETAGTVSPTATTENASFAVAEHPTSVPLLAQSLVVLELSSHQLQTLPYSPHIAVVQNITPEHLDYYKDFEEYVAAKAPIAAHQTPSDYIIYNPEYEIPSRFAQTSPAQKLPYSLTLIPLTQESESFLLAHPGEAQVVAFRKDDQLFYETEAICSVSDLPLQGEHNILNSFPAIIVAKLLGIETEKLKNAITSFKSLPHRLEFVTEKNGVAYYNDSQGTTPEASIAAMRSFPGQEIILLAGGSDKGIEFEELAHEILAQHIKHLILFPPTGEKIAAAVRAADENAGKAAVQSENLSESTASTTPQLHHVSSMQEAVALATANAQPGSVVLLSPACASFGLFKNYQDRGNQFKAAVLGDQKQGQ